MMIIENWCFVNSDTFSDFALPGNSIVLQGTVRSFPDTTNSGKTIRTSLIQSYDIYGNSVTTMNSKYDLGEVNQDFLSYVVTNSYVLSDFANSL